MKRILIFGSILAVTLLILASFPSIVSTSDTEQSNRLYDRFKEIRDKIESDDWWPGMYIIGIIFYILITLFFIIFPTPPPP